MDPITGAVLAAITSYVTSTTQSLISRIGEAAFDKTKKIFERLGARWSTDEAASADLEKFKADPQLYAPVIQTRLERELSHDPNLRREFEELLKEIGPNIKVLQEIAEAKGVVGLKADTMRRGTAVVEQRMDKAVDVTGAQIGTIE